MRLPNPTGKRLTWVAKTYPAPVLYDTISAFAEATAMHSLATAIREERSMWELPSTGNIVSLGGKRPALPFRAGLLEIPSARLSPERSLLQTKFYMDTAAVPMLKSGHTPLDRYLPWAGAQLSKVHRALLKSARRSFRATTPGPGLVSPYSHAVAAALLAAPDLDHASALAREYRPRGPDGEVLNYGDQRLHAAAEPFTDAATAYNSAARQLVMYFLAIVQWADDEDVDLGEYSLAEAIDGAMRHAEEQAEEEDWSAVAENSRVVYEWPDGWTIQELLTTNELVYEGNALRHCIKDYTEDDLVVGGGASRVYSLRNKENRPVVTMEWKTDERLVPVSGLRGFANKTPEMAELSRMYEFRRRCQVFDHSWKPQTVGLDSVNRGENWGGRYTRRIGRDVNGNSLYESVDVYPNGVYDADQIEWALASLLESAAFDDSAYEECLESDYPEWTEQHPDGGECEPCREWADQQDRDRMEDLVRHFDPEDDIPRADLATFDFALDPRVADPEWAPWGAGAKGDLNWLHWLVTGQQLPGWDETDEMQEWLDELHTARALLPGMPPHRHPSVPDGHPHRMVPGPPNVGWVRRSIPTRPGQPDAGWQDQQLHPAGRSVGDWCVSSDLVDAPGDG